MDPNIQDAVRETLRLTRENNTMLHGMRRSAFLWGFIKFFVYAILFAAPIWFYMTYISGSVDELVTAANKIEGTTSQTQARFTGFTDAVKKIESQVSSFIPQYHDTDAASTSAANTH